MLRVFFFFTSVLSCLIIVGELTTFINKRSLVGVLHVCFQSSYMTIFSLIIVCNFLYYLCICCYAGIFEIRLLGYFGFWKNNTTGESMLLSAGYLSKMTSALCYNYLFLIYGSNDNIKNLDFFQVRDFLFFIGFGESWSCAYPWI